MRIRKVKKILDEAKPGPPPKEKTTYQKTTLPDGTVVEHYVPNEVWEKFMQSLSSQPKKKRKLLALTNG